MNRRSFLAGIAASAAATSAFAKTPGIKPATIKKAPAATKQIPSMKAIRKSLAAKPAVTVTPQMKSSVVEIKRKKALRHIAPSIDIQAINFAFGSAEIPYQEHWKVERIAAALQDILHYNPDELFLIEGHTDAVGSFGSNLRLSRRRARSLQKLLMYQFGVPGYALETVGFGEDELLVPTPYAEWRNRRVTLRRITDIVYQ